MAALSEFLVVDNHLDNRSLLTKTLNRKFPGARLLECKDSTTAAAIVHRAEDRDGLPLVEVLRQANPALPILYVSGHDHRAKAFEAGATAFLGYDAWLRVGAAVEDMLKTSPRNRVDEAAG